MSLVAVQGILEHQCWGPEQLRSLLFEEFEFLRDGRGGVPPLLDGLQSRDHFVQTLYFSKGPTRDAETTTMLLEYSDADIQLLGHLLNWQVEVCADLLISE